MRDIWIGIACLTLAFRWLLVALADLMSEEARTRLARIPFAIVRLARARLPRDLRDDLAQEWDAELMFVLTGTEGMPITRLLRGTRFALGLLRAAPAVADGLTGRTRRFGRRRRAHMPVAVGDVWEAIDNSCFRPVRYTAAMGTAYLEGSDGRLIRLPNQSFLDWGLASEELLTILASWGVRPVASGRYPMPANVVPGLGRRTWGGPFNYPGGDTSSSS